MQAAGQRFPVIFAGRGGVPKAQGPPPPADLCTPSFAAQFMILWFETIQEGCRCLQEEREGGGEGREGGREAPQPRPRRHRVLSCSPTHAIKGGDINSGQNRAEKGQVPTRAELGGAEKLS